MLSIRTSFSDSSRDVAMATILGKMVKRPSFGKVAFWNRNIIILISGFIMPMIPPVHVQFFEIWSNNAADWSVRSLYFWDQTREKKQITDSGSSDSVHHTCGVAGKAISWKKSSQIFNAFSKVDLQSDLSRIRRVRIGLEPEPVSYTHLTLPTILRV